MDETHFEKLKNAGPFGRSVHDRLRTALQPGTHRVRHFYAGYTDPSMIAPVLASVQSQFGEPLPQPVANLLSTFGNGFVLRLVTVARDPEDTPFHDDDPFRRDRVQHFSGEACDRAVLLYGAIVDEWDYHDGDDGIEMDGLNYDDNKWTAMPPAAQMFAETNVSVVHEGQKLYYFDYFSSFCQILIGHSAKGWRLYQAKYGKGEIMQIRDEPAASRSAWCAAEFESRKKTKHIPPVRSETCRSRSPQTHHFVCWQSNGVHGRNNS